MAYRATSVVVVILLAAGLSTASYGQANAPPIPTLEVLQPSGEKELSGEVEVLVKVTVPKGASALTVMYVGLGGSDWTEMKPADDADQWKAKIDTRLVPNGVEELRVVTDNRKTRALRKVGIANPLQVYFADLHSHTSYSDGALTPKVAQQYARQTAKLDTFCLTDHLESVDDVEWLDTREQAEDANQDGQFVSFPGLEWTKRWGHMNIFDPKTRLWPSDPAKFYQALADAGVVAKFNHPGDGTESHGGLAYSEVGDRAVQLMEVRHPTEEKAYLRALKLGWHLAPDGSDDTHSPNWGSTRAWTGVLAPGLSQRNILDALAKRHCYSTLDRNCRLHFEVNGATMGDIVAQPAKRVDAHVTVEDADPDDKIAKIEIFEDGQVVGADEPNASCREWQTTFSPGAGDHYYFAKVTQSDGNHLWSAPIWVKIEKEP